MKLKISKKDRKEIEDKWVSISKSKAPSNGEMLCLFVEDYTNLGSTWYEIWDPHPRYVMSSIFTTHAESYLCRALSLNMLLDDNEELLA